MNKKLRLREVEENDINILFQWANDEDCRKNSFNSNMIEYSKHKEWFYNKLRDENCKLYLCIKDNSYIGQARLDIVEQVGVISYSINKEYRGCGYGSIILRLLEEMANSISDIKYLIGKVKYSNKASQSIFKKLGYSFEYKEDYILYSKEIVYVDYS